jgi:hypothetical protein
MKEVVMSNEREADQYETAVNEPPAPRPGPGENGETPESPIPPGETPEREDPQTEERRTERQ